MINYTDFGRVIDIKAFTEEFGEDHKIVITFSLNGLVYPEKLADASYTLNRIRSYPDNYVICDIGEILRAKQKEAADRKELEALKAENEKLKELNKSIGDRCNRLVEECIIYNYKGRIDELEVKCDRLEQDNGIKADALIAAKDRGDYWKHKYHDMEREFNLLKQKYDVIFDAGNLHRDECIKLRDKVEKLGDRWDAMYASLKERGVKVLYLGDVDGYPVIDVKFADERHLYSTQNKKDKEEIEKLTAEVADLRNIQCFLDSRNTSLTIENAELRQELAWYTAEHTVEFLYEKHENNKHIIGWTEVSGGKYELTFRTPNNIYIE